MGVFRVNRGKAIYLYVKNSRVSKYIRVTDSEGRLLTNHKELEKKAKALDGKARPGTGTRHLYLICVKNSAYSYERLAFRAQPPGASSKTFQIGKYGYHEAFLKAKRYLQQLGLECGDLPHPSRFRDMIMENLGELGYRSISKESKNAKLDTETEAQLRATLYGDRRKLRNSR